MNTHCYTALNILLLAIILSSCGQEKGKDQNAASETSKKYQVRTMSIQVPDSWEKLPVQSNGVYVFRNSKYDTTQIFCENLSINFQPNSGKLSLDQVESSILTALPNRYKQFKLISSRDTTIDSAPAKVIDYIVNEQATDLGATMGVVIKNDTVIVLTGMALNQPQGGYIKYRPAIVSAITSLSKDR
jgi:hypothetical protein